MIDHYILDEDHRVVKADLMTWARWFEQRDQRIIEQTTTKKHWVSTVFLGLDHRWGGKGPPLVFETMVFDKRSSMRLIVDHPMMIREEADGEGFFGRWSSWDDAVAGHNSIVRRVKALEAEKIGGG